MPDKPAKGEAYRLDEPVGRDHPIDVDPPRSDKLADAVVLRGVSPVIARGTSWIAMHPDLRALPRIRVVADIVSALFRAEQGAA